MILFLLLLIFLQSKEKIRENVEAELLNIIGIEARNLCSDVYEVDTTNKDIINATNEVIKIIEGEKPVKRYDWLTLNEVKKLQKSFQINL